MRYNDFSIPYDEIMSCHDEINKDNNLKVSETVAVVLKNGMEFDFECCGLKLG